MARVLRRMALLLLPLLLVCACSTPSEVVDVDEVEDSDQITIGMSFDSFIIERWQRDRDAFVAKATKELGAVCNIQSANGDINEQIKQIDYFIQKKVDVIVVVPIDADALAPAMRRAKAAGIKTIAYDRLIKNANVDLYITFDNEMVGTFMAQALINNMPMNAKLLMVCGPEADNNVSLIEKGFMRIIERFGASIMDKIYVPGWKSETGLAFVEDFYRKGGEVDGIMCGNDGLAGPVIRLLSERRLAGKVAIVGQDADLEACQRIVEGTQTMTVYKPIDKLARTAAQYAYELATTGKLSKVKTTFFDGTQDIPYEGLMPIAIYKDNMDIIINDGYHLEEDIYLNVTK